jgi:hypothetical protein
MDMANIMSYEAHERLIKRLFESFMDDVPLGYRRVDMDQLRRADEALFTILVEKTREGIQPRPDGTLPLDAALQEAMVSTKFAWALAPLQAPFGKQHKGDQGKGDKAAPKKGAKGKGKGKGQDRKEEEHPGAKPKAPPTRQNPRMPAELINMASTYKGQNICYNYNMSRGCTQGGSCKRGLHCCCVPDCGGAHPMKDHPC